MQILFIYSGGWQSLCFNRSECSVGRSGLDVGQSMCMFGGRKWAQTICIGSGPSVSKKWFQVPAVMSSIYSSYYLLESQNLSSQSHSQASACFADSSLLSRALLKVNKLNAACPSYCNICEVWIGHKQDVMLMDDI